MPSPRLALRTVTLTAIFGLAGCSGAVVRDSAGSEAQGELAPGESYRPLECQGARFHCKAHARVDAQGNFIRFAGAAPPTRGLGAPELAAAYGIDTTLKPGVTVAIADAYGYTNAESDLAAYRSGYGLPPCTIASGCLTIVNQDGKTSPLPPEGTGNNAGWMGETALDLDMVSAACPNCKILLVQANNADDDGLMIAQQTAASLGAVAVSDSWGGPENQMMTGASQEHYLMTTPRIGIFVASGDSGYNSEQAQDPMQKGPDYPSVSAHVIGVGGTRLTKAPGSARGWSESAWSSGGSSCSTSIAKPSYQGNTACAFRAAADVSAASLGLVVYQSGWSQAAGTSASSPLTAAIFAATSHGEATTAWVYDHTSAFNDVTAGSNGSCGNVLCNAGVGWDGPTGVGTPNAGTLASIPGNSSPPPDMATPPDLATAPDLADSAGAPDGGGIVGGGGAGGGGIGGGGSGAGPSGSGSSGGCAFAGPMGSGGGSIALLLLAFGLFVRRRRA